MARNVIESDFRASKKWPAAAIYNKYCVLIWNVIIIAGKTHTQVGIFRYYIYIMVTIEILFLGTWLTSINNNLSFLNINSIYYNSGASHAGLPVHVVLTLTLQKSVSSAYNIVKSFKYTTVSSSSTHSQLMLQNLSVHYKPTLNAPANHSGIMKKVTVINCQLDEHLFHN